MLMRRFFSFVLATLLVVGGGCSSSREDEITVGAFLSLSGPDSTFGVDTKEGAELAVEEINAAGGVRGKKVRIIYEDDKSTTAEASQKVRQLIDRDKVVAILGEVASSRSIAGGLIANTSKVPMVSPSSTAIEVTQGREWVFRTCYTDDQQGTAIARFVKDTLRKSRVGLFYAAQDAYGTGLSRSFRDEMHRLGGEIVVEKSYPKGETNFRTYLSELKRENPEIIFVPNYYNEMVIIARQASELGIPGGTFVGGDGWDSLNLVEGAGAELEGAHFTNAYATDVPWESSKKFLADYRAKYRHDPTSIGAQGYDGARVLFDAIARAPDLRPESIRQALAETRDFVGATGTMTIDSERNANKPIVVVRITDKSFKYTTELLAPSSAPPPVAKPIPRIEQKAVNLGEALLTGIAQGAMIALVALGYTMVYGVLKLINFAHSEVFMMGAYFGLVFLALLVGEASSLGAVPLSPSAGAALQAYPLAAAGIATVLAMLAAALLGVGVERAAYRPLRRRRGAAAPRSTSLSRVTPLVTALGMSVLLQNLAQLVFSPRYRPYPQVLNGVVHLPGLGAISTSRVLILAAAVAVMIALELVVKRTWFGKAMRALSTNEEAARLMGIRTSRVISTTFALGSALAALGAVLFCFDQSQVYPTMGVVIGTRAFVAAVLGGIGSITGAMLGGLLIGVIGELVKLTDYSGGVDVIVFVVLILVLLVRPAGLLGDARVEKV